PLSLWLLRLRPSLQPAPSSLSLHDALPISGTQLIGGLSLGSLSIRLLLLPLLGLRHICGCHLTARLLVGRLDFLLIGTRLLASRLQARFLRLGHRLLLLQHRTLR